MPRPVDLKGDSDFVPIDWRSSLSVFGCCSPSGLIIVDWFIFPRGSFSSSAFYVILPFSSLLAWFLTFELHRQKDFNTLMRHESSLLCFAFSILSPCFALYSFLWWSTSALLCIMTLSCFSYWMELEDLNDIVTETSRVGSLILETRMHSRQSIVFT